MSNEQPEIMDPEIADALDRKAAAEARAAARRAASDPEQKKRQALEGAALAEAVADLGDVGDAIDTYRTPSGLVIVKRPTPARWKQAGKDMEATESARLEEAAKNLIKDHLVYPSTDAYFRLADLYPALPGKLIGMIGDLARGGARLVSGE